MVVNLLAEAKQPERVSLRGWFLDPGVDRGAGVKLRPLVLSTGLVSLCKSLRADLPASCHRDLPFSSALDFLRLFTLSPSR